MAQGTLGSFMAIPAPWSEQQDICPSWDDLLTPGPESRLHSSPDWSFLGTCVSSLPFFLSTPCRTRPLQGPNERMSRKMLCKLWSIRHFYYHSFPDHSGLEALRSHRGLQRTQGGGSGSLSAVSELPARQPRPRPVWTAASWTLVWLPSL